MSLTWSTPVNNLRNGGAMAREAASRAMEARRTSSLTRLQTNTPIRSGDLAGSESVTVANGEMTFTAGGGKVDYAWYVEGGTVYMSARHYLENTVNELAPAILDDVARAIADEFA